MTEKYKVAIVKGLDGHVISDYYENGRKVEKPTDKIGATVLKNAKDITNKLTSRTGPTRITTTIDMW